MRIAVVIWLRHIHLSFNRLWIFKKIQTGYADSGENLKVSTYIASLIYGVKTPITV